MGGLQLDSREHALQGRQFRCRPSSPAMPDQSLLVQAVTHRHEKFKMPPGGKLQDDEIAAIEAWINAGAVWPDGAGKAIAPPQYTITPAQRAFWAFQPVRDRRAAEGAARRVGEIADRSLHSGRARSAGICKPVPAADRRDLIRRATFDLIGLPPTPGRSERVPGRQIARRIRQGGRPPARLAALRRALGPLLAGYRALLRRPSQLHAGRALSERLPLSRLGDPGVQRRHAVRPVREGADRGRPRCPRPIARNWSRAWDSTRSARNSRTIAWMPPPAASSASPWPARSATITSTIPFRPRIIIRCSASSITARYPNIRWRRKTW